jgi:hypothetical protein
MKTQLFILIFSIASLSVFASGNPAVSAEKNKSLVILTNLWKSANVHVQIKEATGAIILEETLKTNKVGKRYNLKNLPDGQYTIEMFDDLRITSQNFYIKNHEVVVSNDVNTIYKPFIVTGENNLDVNLMTLGKSALLNISDKDNNIVFTEKLNTTAVHKRFDTTALAAGNYTLSIALNGRSFVHDFTK